MEGVNVSVRLSIVEQEPDGEKCILCGDICWLKVFRVFIEDEPTPVTVCQSCSEMY